MHAAAISPRRGIAPKTTRLRGQSIIEYVLIVAVIGLVIVFAGPGVAGAIRNQFSQVTNTVGFGTDGDNFISAEEKAYREAMKTVASKEAKDWTLDEQKAAATDIAKNGTSSVVYAKARAAMEVKVTWSVQLTNGKTLEYRIIGINHDDIAGGGKAGLTFMTVNHPFGEMNYSAPYKSGWKGSNLRESMNSGEIWNQLPSEFQNKITSVTKRTNNFGGESKDAPVTATTDKLFFLSYIEVNDEPNETRLKKYPWYNGEGVLYDAFKSSNPLNHTGSFIIRSFQSRYASAPMVYRPSDHSLNNLFSQSGKGNVCPAFCF